MEMTELQKEDESLAVLTSSFDAGSNTLKSRNRHGWAPAKDPYQDVMSSKRPVSCSGWKNARILLCNYLKRPYMHERLKIVEIFL